MKVAIIGSGISGLTVAYRLCADHEITVFEANDYVGGHTNTIHFSLGGKAYSIDTGFIVFNDWTYPNFINLLNELKVDSQPTEMSFSVRDERTGLEYNGHSINTLFAQRLNLFQPKFYRLLWDILRFNRSAPALLNHNDDQTSVAEFLEKNRYSKSFAEQYLLPMGASIWSCPLGRFSQFPIRFIVEFYQNHGLLNLQNRPTWRVISGGSQCYVRKIILSFQDRIRLNSPVKSVRRSNEHVEVTSRNEKIEIFDHVIFACHSDQAFRILGDDATALEREVLSCFPYERNRAVLHTDTSVLPRCRRAWASWNYRTQGDETAPSTVTYNMNILQGLNDPAHTFCVTLNSSASIDPSRIIKQIEYHHPVYTTRRSFAQSLRKQMINIRNTSYCGAYWGNGFHEDGVVSALEVVNGIQNVNHTIVLKRQQLQKSIDNHSLPSQIA